MKWLYLIELRPGQKLRGVRDSVNTTAFYSLGLIEEVNNDYCWVLWPWGDREKFDKRHLFLIEEDLRSPR